MLAVPVSLRVSGRRTSSRPKFHQNVRVVVYGFFGLVLAAAVAVALSTRRMSRPSALRAIRLGASGLVLVFAAIGVGLVVAFDALFTLFHLIAFPGGGLAVRRHHPADRPALSDPVLGIRGRNAGRLQRRHRPPGRLRHDAPSASHCDP